MKRYIKLVILLSFLLTGNVFAQTGKVKIKSDSLPTALLVIDIQDFYFPGGKLPLVNPEAASENAAKLIRMFRENNLPIIQIQHAGGAPIHENVRPVNGDKLITKKEANSFNGTDLLSYLNSLRVKRLFICGMQTQMCVEATTRAAYDLGFNCIVVEDACATRNLMYGRRTIFAIDVQSCALAIMGGYYARIVKLEDIE